MLVIECEFSKPIAPLLTSLYKALSIAFSDLSEARDTYRLSQISLL